MGELWWFLPLCTFITFLYERIRIPSIKGYKQSKFIYIVLMIVLICFGGFRGEYNDTWTYRDAYTYIVQPFPEAWENFDWQYGEGPAFFLVLSFLKTYKVEVHMFLMFFFFWSMLFEMSFLKKYSVSLTLGLYFFITMGNYTFNMAAIKQVIATAICLLAIPLAVDKKWIKYSIVVILSSFFHPFALMYLIVPLMGFKPWGKWTYVMLTGILIVGVLFDDLALTIVELTNSIGKNYTVEGITGDGISILRILVVWSPIVLSFVYRKILFSDCSRSDRIFMNLSILYAGIILLGRFGTALYFGRLSNYFSIMPAISLPWMLKKITLISPHDGQFFTIAAVIGYFIFFYFSNTLETLFSNSYSALSPSAFLEILIEWGQTINLW